MYITCKRTPLIKQPRTRLLPNHPQNNDHFKGCAAKSAISCTGDAATLLSSPHLLQLTTARLSLHTRLLSSTLVNVRNAPFRLASSPYCAAGESIITVVSRVSLIKIAQTIHQLTHGNPVTRCHVICGSPGILGTKSTSTTFPRCLSSKVYTHYRWYRINVSRNRIIFARFARDSLPIT